MTSIVSIPNNQAVQVTVGRYLYCYFRSATQPFEASFDNGNTWAVYKQNDQVRPQFPTERIYLRPYQGNASDLTIDTGTARFEAQDTALTGSVSTALANNIATNVAFVPLQFIKTANIGAAVKLTAAATYFRWCLLIAQKDMDGDANAGNVNIGFAGGASQQPIVLAPGDQYVLPLPTGAKVDFQNVWLKVANNGDGVVAIYF